MSTPRRRLPWKKYYPKLLHVSRVLWMVNEHGAPNTSNRIRRRNRSIEQSRHKTRNSRSIMPTKRTTTSGKWYKRTRYASSRATLSVIGIGMIFATLVLRNDDVVPATNSGGIRDHDNISNGNGNNNLSQPNHLDHHSFLRKGTKRSPVPLNDFHIPNTQRWANIGKPMRRSLDEDVMVRSITIGWCCALNNVVMATLHAHSAPVAASIP